MPIPPLPKKPVVSWEPEPSPPNAQPVSLPRPAPIARNAANKNVAKKNAAKKTEPIVEPGEWIDVEPIAPPADESETELEEADTPEEAQPKQEQVAAVAELDDEELLSYTASVEGISERLMPEVRAGFRLGRAGAVYAARAQFVSVLRQLALAKDAEQASNRHARLLAEGLRTLDEADDFTPRGDALEAELDVESIARSHGVDLLSALPRTLSPHEAIAIYSRHAAKRLGQAAGGEQAGSMALYGLGKTYARLEAQSGDKLAGRKSMVLHQAALGAHQENHLAANELGVRLARAGRYDQAKRVLVQAASKPTATSTVFQNLATVQKKLGEESHALMASAQAERLASQERTTGAVSRQRGIEWVSPDAFRQPQAGALSGSTAPPPAEPVSQPIAEPPPKSPSWSQAWEYAKRKTGWSAEDANRYDIAQQPGATPMQRALR